MISTVQPDFGHSSFKRFCTVHVFMKLMDVDMDVDLNCDRLILDIFRFEYGICAAGLITPYPSVFCSLLKVLMKSYGC